MKDAIWLAFGRVDRGGEGAQWRREEEAREAGEEGEGQGV